MKKPEAIPGERPTLRTLRRKAGYVNYKDFARDAGLGASTVYEAEHGRPIAMRSALLALTCLQRHAGMEHLTIRAIDWQVRGRLPEGKPTLADLRNQVGLALETVAPLVGLTGRTIHEAERMAAPIELGTAFALLNFYNARLGTGYRLEDLEARVKVPTPDDPPSLKDLRGRVMLAECRQITQQEIADATGLSVRSVLDDEAGRRTIQTSSVQTLLNFYNARLGTDYRPEQIRLSGRTEPRPAR